MIIVHFRGGLGNQLYAAAIYSELKKHREDVYADISEYRQFNVHGGYEVEKIFDISIEKIKHLSDVSKIADYKPSRLGGRLGRKIINSQWPKLAELHDNGTLKPSHLMQSDVDAMDPKESIPYILSKDDVFLDGFWTKTRYHEDVDKTAVFHFSSDIVNAYKEETKELNTENSCSLHIRLGDYVGTDFDKCGEKYYKKAVEYILNNTDDPVFYLFSDDVHLAEAKLNEWAPGCEIRHINTKNVTKAGDDLYLMSCCKNHILANSTYSEWGLMLSEKKDGVNVAPSINNENYTSELLENVKFIEC